MTPKTRKKKEMERTILKQLYKQVLQNQMDINPLFLIKRKKKE